MGKGPGKIQAAIIHRLQHFGPTTTESLRWAIWFQGQPRNTSITRVLNLELPPSWKNNIQRAVTKLAERGRIIVEKRHLATLDELKEHYPGRSLLFDIRLLREQLLPSIVAWCQAKDGPYPRYSTAQNERFELQNYSPAIRRELKSHWLRLEPQLANLYAATHGEGRDRVFRLLCKGKSIFDTPETDCKIEFGRLYHDCCAHFPEPLSEEVRVFAESMFGSTRAGFLKLKSLLRVLVSFPRHGSCKLSDKTLAFLAAEHGQFLRTLPGYVPVPARRLGRGYEFAFDGMHYRPVAGELLQRLFDHKVFQRFNFIRLPDQVPASMNASFADGTNPVSEVVVA